MWHNDDSGVFSKDRIHLSVVIVSSGTKLLLMTPHRIFPPFTKRSLIVARGQKYGTEYGSNSLLIGN